MDTHDGVITLVQEHRFHLTGEDGSHRLFILAHNAPLEWRDLESFERSGSHVRVRYDAAPGMIARTAHDVVEIEQLHQGNPA
ncbi:hypothetical protein [Noviherbaspirillum pedocola]|uniref:Uncharacterized protein n=1 Tax=Noviherbaspirillum pedocola TaxID=2801341 RepID=A0A934W2P7_9BURK|nr:hypothetical protein [Noviherbaspirillum pedocola]MBK4736556.1 hypothetical protein [Noviherbaspirillum pedocola]